MLCDKVTVRGGVSICVFRPTLVPGLVSINVFHLLLLSLLLLFAT